MARVLIVDDNLLVRTLLRDMLTAGGHEVVGEADSGHAAPVLLRELHPDVVTLDLVMPGRDGLTTLPHLLMLDPNLIVVVVSASLTEGRVIEAVRLGARGFLAKPFDRAQVLDAVHEALSDVHGRSAAIDSSPEPATYPDDKREFARVEARVPVVLEASGTRLHAATVNVSGGGMLLAEAPVAPGDTSTSGST